MKNAIKILIMILILGCCPDNDIPQQEMLLVTHFNTNDNLLTVNNIRYFNVLCDREVVSNSGICISQINDQEISIKSDEFIFLDLENLYPPGEYEIIDNEISIKFVTDITNRVLYFDIAVVTE